MTTRRQAPRSCELILSFLFLIFSFSWAAPAAHAEDAAQPAGPASAEKTAFVSPSDMNTGALLLKTEDGRFVEAPRLNTDVNITVTGSIARAVVTQRFENPNDRWLEGIYVFPLPEQSAVDGLRMQIGERVIEGQIKGRDEARKLYEEARDNGQKASLIEQERPNIFTNSVANIGPHESVVVRIEYQETVKQSSGVYSLRFPLVVAPRYSPEPSDVNLVKFGEHPDPSRTDPVPDRDRIDPPVLRPEQGKINPVRLQVTLNAGFALGDVKSSYHQIDLKQSGDQAATVTLAAGTVPADKDFELTWQPKDAAAPQMALFHEKVGDSHYVLAMVTPPSLDSDKPILPREIVFVIDNSGSMAGTSIIQAKQSLLFALGRLRAGDKFNVIRFDDTMDQLFERSVDATSDNLAIAKHFVSRLDAAGGTEMLPALKAALVDPSSSDTTRLRQVVFLTDGDVGNEAELFSEIMAERGRSRLFTVGIGSAPNSYFMRRAAQAGRGTFTEIGSEEQVLSRMTELFSKLERPVMVGLQAEWPSGAKVEAWPDPLPDLYAGEPVIVSAKMDKADGELRLSGEFDGKPWSQTVKLSDAVEGAGVGKLWARNKIDSLENWVFGGGTSDARPEIKQVALEHHLVSSETSLVAVDLTPSRPDGQSTTSTELPLNLPEGWDYDKVFGAPGGKQRAAYNTRAISVGASGSLNNQLAALPLQTPAPSAESGGYGEADAPPAADLEPVPPAADRLAAGTETIAPPQQTATDEAPPQDVQEAPPPAQVEKLLPSFDPERNIAIMLLLLAILSVVTFLMWRHHRRGLAVRGGSGGKSNG